MSTKAMDRHQLTVIYGSDIRRMTADILEHANAASLVPPGASVAIKPNLVVPRPAREGATTHPEIADALLSHLFDHSIRDITIMESSWVGAGTQQAFEVCGYNALARRYGVKIIDLKYDASADVHGIKVCKSALDAGFMINLPVLKGHCQTSLTCALKNMKGCIPDSEKRRFHTLGLHRPIADLSGILRQDLILVDGICGDLDFEEGGNPVEMGRLILGRDPVKIDAYACSLLGLSLSDVPYIEMARNLGAGSAQTEEGDVIGLNAPGLAQSARPSGKVQSLAGYIDEDMACSACYGSLIHALHRLDRSRLKRLNGKIHIGQGFNGKNTGGIGIGACCNGCARFVPGCPPKASDILSFLEKSV